MGSTEERREPLLELKVGSPSRASSHHSIGKEASDPNRQPVPEDEAECGKPKFARADAAREAADKHPARIRLRRLRVQLANLPPQLLRWAILAKKLRLRSLIEEWEARLIHDHWRSRLDDPEFDLHIECEWDATLRQGRDESLFNKIDGVEITPIEYLLVTSEAELENELTPLHPSRFTVWRANLHTLLTRKGAANLANVFARAGAAGAGGVEVQSGNVLDFIPTKSRESTAYLRQAEERSQRGDGVFEFLGLARAFVHSSNGTRVANEVSIPVEITRRQLEDGILRFAEGSMTTSTKHSDKPRSPESAGFTSARAQLVVGGGQHTLIFESYLLGRRWTIRATGAVWVMSAELRGSSASSRIPWIMMNHHGIAQGPEMIYVVDGHFLSCQERQQVAVRDWVAQHGVM